MLRTSSREKSAHFYVYQNSVQSLQWLLEKQCSSICFKQLVVQHVAGNNTDYRETVVYQE